MIKYHGTPITPSSTFLESMYKKNVLISFAQPQDIEKAIKNCKNIILDNGAFSFWTKNKQFNWEKYYLFVEKYIDKIDYYFIPDVIDGTEEENNNLIYEFFNKYKNTYFYNKAIPVWHVDESFERLELLMSNFNYIAFGSSGEYAKLGTTKWHKRIDEAMRIVCNENGIPKVKIHMLRCLDPKIFTLYPFYSGDSTNLARNHKRDGWKNILNRIENYNSPSKYIFRNYYETRSLFLCL